MDIQVRNECKTCDGCGKVTNKLYQELDKEEKEFEVENKRTMTFAELEQWFRDKGYSKMPPEEYQCPDCEGEGLVYSWVSIIELKTMLQATNTDIS